VLRGDGIVATSMSNFGLEIFLKDLGLNLYRSDVGDRYVLLEMLARGANLGGEQSGHVISLEHNTTGDGTLTALLVISTMLREQKPLSFYQSLITRYPQRLNSFKVEKKVPFDELPTVKNALHAAETELTGKGRIVLRYSGTELKARVMVECEDSVVCERITTELSDTIKSALAAK
jgi:phosphoglucosamine mutase